MGRISVWLIVIVAPFLCSVVPQVQANDKKAARAVQRAFKNISKGDPYLGGKQPQLIKMDVVREFDKTSQGDKVYYLYKALVRRTPGDENGRLVLFKARNYRDAMVKFLQVDPGYQRMLDLFFPKSLDKRTPFSPVQLTYKYIIEIKGLDNNFWLVSNAPKKPRGKDKFVEIMQRGLQPGSYEVLLHVRLEIEHKDLEEMMNVWEWIKFVANLKDVLPYNIHEYSQYFRLTGLSKKLFKKILINKASTTKSVSRLEVLAKLPNLKGKLPSQAVKLIQGRNLNYESVNTTNCSKKRVNKVVKQWPKKGSWLKKGSKVRIAVCREKQTTSSSCNRIAGTWDWFTGVAVLIKSDHTLFTIHPTLGKMTGTWRCLSDKNRNYQLTWQWQGQTFIDTVWVTPDYNSLSGNNQQGHYISGTRQKKADKCDFWCWYRCIDKCPVGPSRNECVAYCRCSCPGCKLDTDRCS